MPCTALFQGFSITGIKDKGNSPEAGESILAQEDIEDYVTLEKLFARSQDTFLLKVAGDSMIDVGIMDGDYVVVKPGSRAESGKIAVVLLGLTNARNNLLN